MPSSEHLGAAGGARGGGGPGGGALGGGALSPRGLSPRAVAAAPAPVVGGLSAHLGGLREALPYLDPPRRAPSTLDPPRRDPQSDPPRRNRPHSPPTSDPPRLDPSVLPAHLDPYLLKLQRAESTESSRSRSQLTNSLESVESRDESSRYEDGRYENGRHNSLESVDRRDEIGRYEGSRYGDGGRHDGGRRDGGRRDGGRRDGGREHGRYEREGRAESCVVAPAATGVSRQRSASSVRSESLSRSTSHSGGSDELTPVKSHHTPWRDGETKPRVDGLSDRISSNIAGLRGSLSGRHY